MTDQTKHTRGPWHYGADDCPDNESALAICKENIDAHTQPSSGYFFVVYLEDGRRTALVGHGPNGEANARLIAAAPELLGACLAMIEWDDRENDHAVSFEDRMNLCREAFEKARIAIAKATGSAT